MKVLHINSYYSKSRFYKGMYDLQVEKGLDLSVFVSVPYSFKRGQDDFGVYTTVSANHLKYDRLFFFLKHRKILKDIQKKYIITDYSVSHAHSLFSNGIIAMKLKQKYGMPYIVAVRSTDVNIFFKKMIHLRKMGNKILQNADKIVFLSTTYKDEVINKYVPEKLKQSIEHKACIIPNGIDEFWFKHMGSPKQSPKLPCLRLLQVGELSRNKNILITVQTVNILIQRGYQVQLDVVGKEKDPMCLKGIKDLDYVNYLGYKSKEELRDIYQENDIFVLPSMNETFGLVYAEAMSQGLPVIYTKGQGFDRQFQEGVVGYSVNCLEPKNIADKIVEILQRYQQMSKKCIESCNKFSWNQIDYIYEKIYKSL